MQTPESKARSAVRLGALLMGLLGAVFPRVAAADGADGVETARALFVEATKLGNQGRWKEALELYTRSLELKPAPITRYSLGVAQKETGHLADALGSFRAFLAEPPVQATMPYVEPARAAILALERSTGRVAVIVEPHPVDGLTLAIDGAAARPAATRPLEVEPGAHEVVARAPGFSDATARFSVAAGGSAVVAITLTHGGVTAHRALPIVLLGLGGALFTGGVALGLVGVVEAGHAETRSSPEASGARSKGIAGDVIGGLGIATAAAGLIVLLTQGRSNAPIAAAVRPSVSGSCSGIELRF